MKQEDIPSLHKVLFKEHLTRESQELFDDAEFKLPEILAYFEKMNEVEKKYDQATGRYLPESPEEEYRDAKCFAALAIVHFELAAHEIVGFPAMETVPVAILRNEKIGIVPVNKVKPYFRNGESAEEMYRIAVANVQNYLCLRDDARAWEKSSAEEKQAGQAN